jgi:hypothetical protein
MAQGSSLASWLLRFAHVFALQVAQTAIANVRGKIEERLARRLLMAHDRVDGDEIDLTHENIGMMLGSRRESVTIALNRFEAEALISTAVGRVRIYDRTELERIAGGLYGAPEDEFDRVFPMLRSARRLSEARPPR